MANSDLVQSVLKALDILQLVAEHPEGLKLNELAGRLDLKTPTAHNLVRTLKARNFLQQDQNRYLRLGNGPVELIAQSRRGGMLLAAENVLRRLYRSHPEATITFSERSGDEIFCRLRMSPDRPGEMQKPLAFTYPWYSTMTGVVMLASGFGEDPGELSRKYPFSEFGLPFWQSEAQFLAMLDKVREQGFAVRNTADGGMVAAILVRRRFALGIALTGAFAGRFKSALQLLQTTAEELAR